MGDIKPSYASEVMLRVSWSCLNHADGQPQHTRRGEVMLDLGLEMNPEPDLSNEEMQSVALAAKMAALKALAKRPKTGAALSDAMWRKLEWIADGLSGLEVRGGAGRSIRALERRGLVEYFDSRGFRLTDKGLEVMQSRLNAQRAARGAKP